MDGVTILTTSEVATSTVANNNAGVIAFLITFAILTIINIIVNFGDYEIDLLSFFGIGAITIAASIVFGCMFSEILAEDCDFVTEYQVIISEDVLLKEFNDKYEIVDRNGEIYTVREVLPDEIVD